MAEALFIGVAKKIVSFIGPIATEDLKLAWDVKKQLERLKDTVSTIGAELQHAEELQVTVIEVREWLQRLKDAAYEADDILDECALEAFNQKGVINTVRNFVSSSNPIISHFKIASRIQEVREKLSDIASDKSFHLDTRIEGRHIPYKERENTHSHVDVSKVYGREDDKEKIVELLLDINGQEENISIIPIQGLGGLGKTTLAQFVYNDERASTFMPKMWVCVSEQFNLKKIIKMILKSATNNECPSLEMDQLQSRLREQLDGKKFLLVLDDVWNENVEKWNELEDLLIGGAKGSKIIVTTRSEKVASIAGTVSTYQLPGLSNDDCWNLFKLMAFEGREQAYPNLVQTGKEILRKCRGVPLAAKTLGSLLNYKTEQYEWEFVRDNDISRLPQEENSVLPALKLSYTHLPSSSLKRCFAYCSIFPKNHRIEKEMLIKLWIAQGFLHSSEENQSLEDVGNQYVRVLLWRSLFQDPKVDQYKNLISFQMHGLVHELARSVAGVECYIAEKGTKEYIPEGVRHVCFIQESVTSETLGVLSNTTNLRTLIIQSQFTSSVNNIFARLSFLRVLIIKHFDGDNFPSSIGKLKHLKYLELCSHHIKTLPKSFAQLHSLQTLKLWCEKLEELPREMGEMINLRHIFVERCSSLSHMPLDLRHLTSLQTLSTFIVSNGEIGCDLNELHGLQHLGGTLTIKNLENFSSSTSSAAVNLKGKPNLRALRLSWNEVEDGVKNEVAFDVLGNLESHRNLTRLKLEGYGGARFPRWVMNPLLPNLTKFTLSNCRNCQHLPPFDQLSSLKVLKLEKMDAIQSIEGLQGMTSLVSLNISDCESLTSLYGIQYLTALENLRLVRCKDMQLSEDMDCLVSLQTLEIEGIPKLVLLPEGLQNATALKTLKIRNCGGLIELPEYMGEFTLLKNLTIFHCDNLMVWPDGFRNLTSLEFLHISSSSHLQFLPEELQYLTAMQYLGIADFEGLMILPGWLGNLNSLRLLQIYGCQNLMCLPVRIQHLTELEELHIDLCDLLTHRCHKDTGEDWPQIAHIPKIILNRMRIK